MDELAFDAVYLARHGQTEWNVQRRRQGRLDSPLTELGVLQVRRNAELLSREPIDAVFTSPMGRAHSSATVLAHALGLPVQVLDALSEVDHGTLSGLILAEADAAFPEQAEARRRDKFNYRFPGGESYADVDIRAARALAEVASTGTRTPLLVSHEMIGRMLLKNLAGLDPDQALGLHQPSDVVYRVLPATATIETLAATPYPRPGTR